MPLKIIRNDITRMNTEAVVNTANSHPVIGSGCDTAVYAAAGRDELLKYRIDHIGSVKEGEAFITPGFNLQADYIIHAVSPLYKDGRHGEEKKLRSCYKKSLQLAKENNIKTLAFPLISTGSFGYPKEEGLRIAADEIMSFLLFNKMDIYLVVFDDKATQLGKKLYPELESYIDCKYLQDEIDREYSASETDRESYAERPQRNLNLNTKRKYGTGNHFCAPMSAAFYSEQEERCNSDETGRIESAEPIVNEFKESYGFINADSETGFDFEEVHQGKLEERMKHISDTFSQYLLYLIQEKHMENAEVYKRAIVDKKTFSKIKNNKNYHPNRITALCLCVGAKLNMDESRDLLARAGYALSPSDKTDIIFSYFIENEIYDMIELDIQLEEHGLPCLIS